MKKILYILCFLLGGYTFGQQTLLFDSGKLVDSVLSTVPTRDVVNTSTGIEVTYDFSSAIIIKDDLFPSHYLWKIDGFGLNDISGAPSTLLRIDLFGIPDGKVCQIEVVETRYKDFEYVLSPARPPLVDNGNESHTKNNVKPIDSTITIFPEQIVQEESIQKYRGKGILNVRVSPIQYNVSTGKTRVFTHIKYVVSFAEKKGQARASSIGRDTLTHSFSVDDNFLLNTLLNASNGDKQKAGASARLNQQDYLIISVPKYETAVQQFSEWKKLMGFNVHTIIKSNWTTATVKSEVQKFYDENANFYFLLIVGDHEDVPAVFSSYGNYTHVTDLPYACMDGDDDYVADIYLGRLSVSSSSEASVVVNKIINYEKSPITMASFYNTGVNCAYFQDEGNEDWTKIDGYADRRFAQTAEEIRTYLLGQGKSVQRIYYTRSSVNPTNWSKTFSYGEPIPAELRKPGFAWNGNATDIIKAINTGVFYVLHRDHGNYTCWGDPYFDQNNIRNLSNGNKLPVVFSMNCQTGQFNGRTCFTETFLRKSNGGCVAIYGATQNSYTPYNDILTGGMFDAIWPNPGLRVIIPGQISNGTTPTPTYQLGQILNQGLTRMSEIYGIRDSLGRYTREIFHCFGDPSMQIYTAEPAPFQNVLCEQKDGGITVSLSGENGTITFYDLITGNVISYVGTSATYKTQFPKNVSICVSNHNKIPYVQIGKNPTTIYIQNETIVGTRNYEATFINIGNSVTTEKTQGPVIFNGGSITLTGSKIQLCPGTIISGGTEFTIIPE